MGAMTASDDLRAVSDDYWEARLQASPLYASFLGDHRFDDQADDLSAGAAQGHRATWTALRARVEAIPTDGVDDTDAATHQLLAQELDEAVRTIDLRLLELASDQMEGPHVDLLMLAAQLRAPDPEAAAMAVTRTVAFGTMLDQAAERFREGLAAGRTPARTNIERSLNIVDSYLATDVADDPFVGLAGPDDWDGEDRWRQDLTSAVAGELRPAFARYRAALADELLPVARPDERCGLQWLDDGAELYQALIELHTGLPLTPEELHQVGLEEVNDTLPAQYREVGGRQFGTDDLREIYRHLLDDPDLKYRDGDEILADARAALDAATEAMGDWFGILPEAPCVLTPVPDFLAADSPAAYYTPPAPDGSRPGEYHVNLHDAAARARAETASIAYHEAIPGHHLQLAIASERTDLPAFRRLSWGHTAFVEGWALYTERLADEMGLYRTDLDRLGMLASDSWRACRLVVDTGLHAMGWTRQQAIDFMVQHAPVAAEEIVVEVDRYIGMPGQALAYKVGQREILALRDDARRALGDRFDIKTFHDHVLGGATISLPVLRNRIADWTTSAA
jgi:uncharacterized protein (DUF885 family)